MKRLIILLLAVFTAHLIKAQDTIKTLTINEIVVTASRTQQKLLDIPASISIIQKSDIQDIPALSTDDLLFRIPGINIDRDYGIFSKNSSISMRGLNGGQRSLILLDGVPLNKTDGGGINWNRINPDLIERIEVVKGAGSAIYGSNAMSGVINIISQRPENGLSGKIKTFYGGYNTSGGNLFLNGARLKDQRGFYFGANAFFRKGDGYMPEPFETRDSLDAKTYMTEYSTLLKAGYQWNKNTYSEIEYNFYDNKTGDGTRVYETDGGYNRYLTNNLRVTINSEFKNWQINLNSFYQNENYLRQSETIKKQNKKYTLYNTDASRVDLGVWATAKYNFTKKQHVIFGIDVKQGTVDAEDNYKSSSDILTNKGNMNFAALFMHYEISLLQNKVKLVAGIRYDAALFNNGSFTIDEPSSLTDFMTKYPTVFKDTAWHSVSPKISALYNFNPFSKLYFSIARGFRPPILDDMCKNGNITKGFKQANPQLQPETLLNFEIGYSTRLFKNLAIDQAVYYSTGSDFQYFISRGDSVYTGGDNLKPVLQRQNVSNVEIFGTELSLNYKFSDYLTIIGNYAYNHSIIKKYTLKTANDKDLTGKYLMEVPKHQAYITLDWKSKYINTALSYNYRDKQFSDDENLTFTGVHSTFNVQVSASWNSKIYGSCTIQDIFNQRFTDSKGMLSPGRFVMLSLIYKFQTNQ